MPHRSISRPSTVLGDTQERLLLGPLHLQDTLSLVASLEGLIDVPERGRLADRWRKASSEYQRLAKSEAGAADNADIRPLPKGTQAHVAQLIDLPGARRTFDTVPVAFGMVELDKLVISQYSMTQWVVDRIVDRHPPPVRASRLMELCLPLKPPEAHFRLVEKSARHFTFIADAHDMRFLEAQVLDPRDVRLASTKGHPKAVVALSVGFSTNLINGVRYNGRVAINNGHHRVLALRKMGFTHAPCLIQACQTEEDLGQAATSELCDNVDLYFHSPRPPLLRDFDNPRLTLSVKAPRMHRVVTLKVEVERHQMAL